MKTVFISYSQKDRDRVTLFASIMAQNGFDIWMDTKSIPFGNTIISSIVDGLENADIYMLFVSRNSAMSPWVNEELNLALTRNIEHSRPTIIPVLLEDCPLPSVLNGRRYLDARKSIQDALSQLNDEYSEESINANNLVINSPKKPILSEVVFGLSQKTTISFGGPFCGDFTKEELISDRESIQKQLRKKANGILMNFVPLSDFDLQSPLPKFKNGVYDEVIERITGSMDASICERITANVSIFNPDEIRVNELVKNKLDKLSATSLTYVFSIPFQKKDFDKKCMQIIQEAYPIISYDFENGATIEYDSNFFVSIQCSLEQIKIKIEAEYDFTFSEKAVCFSPSEFIDWMLKSN